MVARHSKSTKIFKVTPQDILARHTPEVRRLVNRLREVVKTTVPGVLEKAYPVWRGIGYRHPESGYFCGIFPQKDFVKVGFEFGAFLPDPDGILTSGGRQVKYVEVKSLKEIPVSSLRNLLRCAVKLRRF